MNIRPIHKNLAGNYESSCKEWLFVGYFLEKSSQYREWHAYQRMPDNLFHKDTPYFYQPHPTLKSLIAALEKAKPIKEFNYVDNSSKNTT